VNNWKYKYTIFGVQGLVPLVHLVCGANRVGHLQPESRGSQCQRTGWTEQDTPATDDVILDRCSQMAFAVVSHVTAQQIDRSMNDIPNGIWLNFERFEVFTAVTMKNGVFWGVTPCGSCKNRRFGGT
jgi:hypothetical protein